MFKFGSLLKELKGAHHAKSTFYSHVMKFIKQYLQDFKGSFVIVAKTPDFVPFSKSFAE